MTVPVRGLARVALALGAVLSLALGSTPQAGAATTAGGTLVFAGTATLPTFPCAPPAPEELPCVGTFVGSFSGTLTGVDESAPWEVSLNAPTTSTFAYADLIEPGVPCLEGVAAGSTSVDTSMAGQAFGTYHVQAVPVPVRNVRLSYSFTWLRRGLTALIHDEQVTVELQVGPAQWVTVLTDGKADALATFMPHVTGNELPEGCAGGEPTELSGSIVGQMAGITAQTDE